jgi:hypothetical protein
MLVILWGHNTQWFPQFWVAFVIIPNWFKDLNPLSKKAV